MSPVINLSRRQFLKAGALAGGMGEVAVPTVAPALAGAVFAVMGRRLHRLPVDLGEA